MSNVIESISDKDMKELIKAYVTYKKAEANFTKLKKKLTEHLMLGVYESKYGKINKFISVRKLTNFEKLYEDYPEIEKIIEKYKEEKEQTSVLITNQMD